MLLKDLIKSESYIYTERYVNQFKKVVNEIPKEYCPIEGNSSFLIPHLNLTLDDRVSLFLANPREGVYNKIISGNNLKFYLHPEMVNEINHNGLIWDTIVEPTSSVRTVLPKEENYALKLHLNRRLSKYIRRLSRSSVKHSILISSEIDSALIRSPESFAYLPESIGVCYQDIGMIVREMIPRPEVKDERVMVPLFSLYSRDLKKEGDDPLFVQLAGLKNKDPLDYLIGKIIEPLFRNMGFFINNYGILLEPHGQNVLAEIDADFEIKRLVHRDFQSIYVDNEIRRTRELGTLVEKHIMGVECPKEISYSLVYDQFVGQYLFDNFVSLLNSYYCISEEKIIDSIRQIFNEYFDLNLFPKGCYYFMKKEMFQNNNTVFDRFNEKPRYRP